MSPSGQSRHFGDVRVTSALPLKTDIYRKGRHVSKVPGTDSCTAPDGSLFDHLVRACEQRSRYFEAECLCGLEINDEFELGGLLDG